MAKRRMARNGFMATPSLRRGQWCFSETAGLLASGSFFAHRLPTFSAVASLARVVAGHSGGGRAGIAPASRSPNQSRLRKNVRGDLTPHVIPSVARDLEARAARHRHHQVPRYARDDAAVHART